MASYKQSTSRSDQTVREIVKIRTRRFAGSIGLVMLTMLVLVEAYVLSVAFSRASTATDSWLAGNKQRIEQALFLENALAITGLLSETDRLNANASQRISGISVQDNLGRAVATAGSFRNGDHSQGRLSNAFALLSGVLRRSTELEFADIPQGRLVVESTIDRHTLFQTAGIMLLITVVVIIAINLSARSLLNELKARVLNPLSAMTNAIAQPDSAAKNRTLLHLPEDIFSLAAVEMKQLVETQNDLMIQISLFNERERIHAELVHKTAVATQVSHDIRSPLSALKMVLGITKGLAVDERALIQAAINRISSIAQELLDRSRLAAAEIASGSFDAAQAVRDIVTEKKLEYRDSEVDWKVSGCDGDALVRGDAQQFKTVLSNLINNSFESLSGEGSIFIDLTVSKNQVTVELSDTGCGIPREILPRLGKEPVTKGKTEGNGLGVYSAVKTIQSFGGNVEFSVRNSGGSTVRLSLRRHLDELLLKEIDLRLHSNVVIVDDDLAIAEAWRMTLPEDISLLTFTQPSDFLASVEANSFVTGTIFLIDHQFNNSHETGLDIIERLNLQDRSVLVTGQASDPTLRSRARRSRIRVMSKDDIHRGALVTEMPVVG